MLLAVVSKINNSRGSVLHGVTHCFLLSTSQFTSQVGTIGFLILPKVILTTAIFKVLARNLEFEFF